VFEPIHGSAPHMTGTGRANPTGTILSFAILRRLALGLEAEAAAVERAVSEAIEAGVRTPDIAEPGMNPVTTGAFGEAVSQRIRR
jgi:3-isopropylmalate dehydrogenase